MKIRRILTVGFFVGILVSPVLAGTLTGTVKNNDGKVLEGVLVRLSDQKSGLSESVFTNQKGAFKFKTTLNGELTLRLRAPYHRDVETEINLGGNTKLKRSDTMQILTDPQEISESLPAAYYFGSLPFETGKDAKLSKTQFQRDCLTCHQLGNAFTRYPRSVADWTVIVKRMHSFMGNFDADLIAQRASLLAKGFDGKPLTVRPVFPFDPALAHAKIYEYPLPETVLPHDAEVSPDDGLIYTIDQFAEMIAITDPETGATSYYKQPDDGSPLGGKFTKLKLSVTVGNTLRHGPHSLAIGPDGKWYTTNAISGEIGVFNPKTRKWEASIEVGGNALYPHTIRFDKAGIAWFTLAFSDQIGRLDPKTRKVDVIDLPPVKSLGFAGGSTPYGIDVNPKDGTVWYGRLFGDKIGKIDPKTLKVTEYNSPVKGPRRMRFDKNGIMWLPGYSEGMLARIDPEGFKVKLYPMPEYVKGDHSAPYSLGINPESQEIWINDTMTDRIYRFLPKEERFIAYPMPLRGTYTRDASFTKDGKVCMSNNPIPVEALEGSVLELICIDPNAQ